MIKNVEPARFKHFANTGDVVAAMAAMKSYYLGTGRKVILSQQLNMKANYYPGATHPVVDENGTMVCMNRAMFDMVKPLVESQDYIHSMEIFEGQDYWVDLDIYRGEELFVNIPYGAIQSWAMLAYPDLALDLSKAWIRLPEKEESGLEHITRQVSGKVIVNFTERYRNPKITYYFLKKFQHNLIFAGTDREYLLYANSWRLDIPRLQIKDMLEYAYAIREAKFLIGNQSVGWGISEAMKTPRILEICRYAPNCNPFYGEHSYGYYHQSGVEYYFDKLYGLDTEHKKRRSQALD